MGFVPVPITTVMFELTEMLARLHRLEVELSACRGSLGDVQSLESALRFEQQRIRRHCQAHDLPLPSDVPRDRR